MLANRIISKYKSTCVFQNSKWFLHQVLFVFFFFFHISTDILSDGKLKAVGELITLENKLVCFLKQMPDVVVAVCFVVLFLLLIFSRTRI